MFVRTKTTPNSPRKSVQVVEAYRVDGKVKQKIVRHIGIAADDESLARLLELAEYQKAQLEASHQPQLFSPEEVVEQISALPVKTELSPSVNLFELREEARVVVGIHQVYGELYQQLNLDAVFGSRQSSWRQVFKDMVMARIANPASKRESVRLLEEDFGLHHSLDSVYRLLDKIDVEAIERLQKIALQQATDIIGHPISVLFYDCTTLYFESFDEDDLRQKGFSKDHKAQETQVLLAVMTTAEGLPVGYEIFPGATFEGHSLIPVLTALKARYTLDKVVFVADRGLFSEENLVFLEEAGLQYVVGARVKNVSSTLTNNILNTENYTPVTLTYSGNIDTVTAAEFTLNGRRLVVSHSASRAHKDKEDRDTYLEKLRTKMSRSSNIKSFVSYSKKYLMQSGEATMAIDPDKIKQVERFDGLAGIITNADAPIETLLAHYHGLWHIEETFRISKHDLRIRPIFHWKPARIKAHLAICFAALLCVRHLTYRTALQYQRLSPEVIRRELVHVQISVLKHRKTGHRYALPSAAGAHATKLYKLMGLPLHDTPYRLE